MKKIFILIMLLSLIFADTLAQEGVDVKVKTKDGKSEEVVVSRDIPDKCEDGFKISAKALWGEKFASKDIPDPCKVTIVSTVGTISPIKIAKDVETYGELEVLKFLQDMQKDSSKLFIDSRTPSWFNEQTIPGATNIPFTHFVKKELKDKLLEDLKLLGVKVSKDKLDFSSAKEILLFCNGAWCGQSPASIKALLKLGYPAKKIKWYRGGMHSWNSLSLTTTKE